MIESRNVVRILLPDVPVPISNTIELRSNEMSQSLTDILFDATAVEVIPPLDQGAEYGSRICLCCQRTTKSMDDDGCGICNDCLSPEWRPGALTISVER